ncbi:hypothetical protein GKE73_00605 [Paludibacterium sp. dN 18-1]|uniref:Outer membrane efflux protein n=1 Tax=Paludibacterium denitrificans TaxID=2675226 RepID=A0A844G7L4_9NEIS|nr:TolC family protein [Paludibacterium denitrificans]MTD32336.1 hypothetical protein [Paludibacterium denitrificans]
MAYPVINRCLVPLLLGLVLLPASAETLEQAWSQALGSSRTLKAEARKVDAASEQRHAAQAAAGPVVSLQGNWLKLEREPKARMDLSPLTSGLPLPLRGLLPGSMEASLSDDQVTLAEARISLPVYTSGRLTHLHDAAQAAEQAAQYGEERTRQDVKLDVAEAYFNVLRARDAEQVARELLTSLSAYRRDVGNFYQKGLVARGDVLGADVAVADARQKLIAAGQAASVARAAYNRLLGLAVWSAGEPRRGELPARTAQPAATYRVGRKPAAGTGGAGRLVQFAGGQGQKREGGSRAASGRVCLVHLSG